MASDEWRKPVEPRIPQLCLTESPRRNPPVTTSMGWTVQSSMFKVQGWGCDR